MAIQDVLASQQAPRKARKASLREKTVQLLQPRILQDAWGDLVQRLPDTWRDRAEQVLPYAPVIQVTEDPFTPVARSKGRLSRRIEIPRGFAWLLFGFADTATLLATPWIRAMTEARESQPPRTVSIDEMWQTVAEMTDLFASTYQPSNQEQESLRWLRHAIDDPIAAGAERGARSEEDRDTALETTCPLIYHGMQFALAHELGHHLLNHLHPQTDVADLDVLGEISDWVDTIGVGHPEGLNQQQEREWWCDAFAMRTLTSPMVTDREKSHDTSAVTIDSSKEADELPNGALPEFWQIVAVSGGASIALLSMFVAGELLDESGDVRKTEHPSVELRLKLVALATTLIGRRVRRPGMTDEEVVVPMKPDAGQYAMQTFGVSSTALTLLGRMR